jgi:hypothetical protein
MKLVWLIGFSNRHRDTGLVMGLAVDENEAKNAIKAVNMQILDEFQKCVTSLFLLCSLVSRSLILTLPHLSYLTLLLFIILDTGTRLHVSIMFQPKMPISKMPWFTCGYLTCLMPWGITRRNVRMFLLLLWMWPKQTGRKPFLMKVRHYYYYHKLNLTLSCCRLEMIVDPHVNDWVLNRDNRLMYCCEVCDAVQGNSYSKILPSSVPVVVTDFVLPAYFTPKCNVPLKQKVHYFDAVLQQEVLPAPHFTWVLWLFKILVGGYMPVMDVHTGEGITYVW